MPRKFSRRGKRSYKRKSSYGMTKLAREVRAIKKSIEHKFIDYTASLQNAGTAVTADEILQYIVQGDGAGTRTGNQIALTGISIKYILYSSSDAYNVMRVVLAYARSVGLATADFLDGSSQVQFLKNQNREKVDVIYDAVRPIDTKVAAYNHSVFIKKYFSLKKNPKIIRYTTGVAIPTANPIYFAYVSDSVATPYPFISYAIRLYYTDA